MPCTPTQRKVQDSQQNQEESTWAGKKKSLSLPLTVVVKLDEQGNGRRKILHSLEYPLGPVCSVTCSQGEWGGCRVKLPYQKGNK